MREMGYMMSGLTTGTKNVQHGESKTKKVNSIKKEGQNYKVKSNAKRAQHNALAN